MTLNANALITLEDFKLYAGIDAADSKNDALYELIINSVSQRFDTEANRIFKSAVYTNAYLDGTGTEYLYLPNYPIIGTITITENDETLTVGDDYDYLLIADRGLLWRIGVWALGSQNIKVTYTGGYTATTMPGDLMLACLKQCAKEWRTQMAGNWGETSRSYPDGSVSHEVKDLLEDVKVVVNRYRRLNF